MTKQRFRVDTVSTSCLCVDRVIACCDVSCVCLVWLALACGSQAADTVTVPNCLLSLDAEAQVPAQEAGVLMKIPVREGPTSGRRRLLAQIDDLIPQRSTTWPSFKLKVAEKQATDDVDVRYATAACRRGRGRSCEQYLDANPKTPGTVPRPRSTSSGWTATRFVLSIEKARRTWPSPACRSR